MRKEIPNLVPILVAVFFVVITIWYLYLATAQNITSGDIAGEGIRTSALNTVKTNLN